MRQRLKMAYAGAEWVQKQLDATRHGYEKNQRRRRPYQGAKTMSPLGVAVADLLGLVFRGIYHLDWNWIERVQWDNEHHVQITIGDELATWDFNYLTQLVVLGHDMLLRVSVRAVGPGRLRLGFSQRHAREGAMHERMPTLEQHTEMIRKAYTIWYPVDPSPIEASIDEQEHAS